MLEHEAPSSTSWKPKPPQHGFVCVSTDIEPYPRFAKAFFNWSLMAGKVEVSYCSDGKVCIAPSLLADIAFMKLRISWPTLPWLD